MHSSTTIDGSDSVQPLLSCMPFSSPEESLDLPSFSLEEDDLLAPSMEVSASLSVCGNIHQARHFPFWDEVLKCSPWHKNILREGLKLDFTSGIIWAPAGSPLSSEILWTPWLRRISSTKWKPNPSVSILWQSPLASCLLVLESSAFAGTDQPNAQEDVS